MRVKSIFTVYPRKAGARKVVWYYQTYDENGRRTNGLSTGETTRTMAVRRCTALYREGKLLPAQRVKTQTFGEYAADWWNWDTCLYLKKQKARKNLTEGYVKNCRRMMMDFLVPYFGKIPLNRITEEDIEEWLVTFADRARAKAEKEGSGKREVKNSYANVVLCLLSLMLSEAVKRRLIAANPAANVKRLFGTREQTVETEEGLSGEMKLTHQLAYTANILAFVCRASGYLARV